MPSAAVVGAVAFVLIGWSGLLVPSLIRSIEDAFAQTDAGMGVFYFLFATAYAAGSLGGGLVTERVGRRAVLASAAALLGGGLLALGLAPSWLVLLGAALPAGLGAGAIDGGANGLVLDLFPASRGRALNLLHLFFSLGALGAPLAVGRLLEGGTAWEPIVLATGFAAVAVSVGFGVVAMPHGRRRYEPGSHRRPGRPGPPRQPRRRRLANPLLLLAVAIAAYVASEVGVSNWLVRFLEPAPVTQATTALALFWGGLAVGRLVGARAGERFDHLVFAAAASGLMAIAILGAVLVPSLAISTALFALAGFASGPIFPMIIAIGGERYPGRSAAVSGFLASAGVAGSIVYPPVIGFLSVSVGLTVAMLGNVVLALACAAALLLVGRRGVRR